MAIIKTNLERAIENQLGEPIDLIRQTPIDERRKIVEKKHGKRMQFRSYFPLVGRNVLHGKILTHEEVEASLDKALK